MFQTFNKRLFTNYYVPFLPLFLGPNCANAVIPVENPWHHFLKQLKARAFVEKELEVFAGASSSSSREIPHGNNVEDF